MTESQLITQFFRLREELAEHGLILKHGDGPVFAITNGSKVIHDGKTGFVFHTFKTLDECDGYLNGVLACKKCGGDFTAPGEDRK